MQLTHIRIAFADNHSFKVGKVNDDNELVGSALEFNNLDALVAWLCKELPDLDMWRTRHELFAASKQCNLVNISPELVMSKLETKHKAKFDEVQLAPYGVNLPTR